MIAKKSSSIQQKYKCDKYSVDKYEHEIPLNINNCAQMRNKNLKERENKS